jgi:hypothetical protein
VLIVDLDQQTKEALRQKPLSGYVSLQNHGGNNVFRSPRVREINGSGSKAVKASRAALSWFGVAIAR